MTDRELTSDGGQVLTLQELIQRARDARGWSYEDLAARSGHALTRGRWQQLGTHKRMRAFPDPDNIPVIAAALEVNQTTVVLAVAKSLRLDVQWRGPDLAQLMPSGTDELSPPVRDAILGVIRATVTEALARQSDSESLSTVSSGPSVLEWEKTSRPPARTGQPPTRTGQEPTQTGGNATANLGE